ncbi:sugar transferase [Guggenheimella bovis]
MFYKHFLKRVFDILGSLVLLPFVILIGIPVAIFIKLDDGGPIFYSGLRLGKNMKPFPMHKFRSMKVNAPDIRNEDGSTFNSEKDPRLTRLGNFLRKSSIDELPQILNVLKGDMSFVGPRPSPLGNEARYTEAFKKKFQVLPGITGYNQAVLRNASTMEERTYYDTYYVDHVSLLLDLKIIWLTAVGVLRRKGINRNDGK